MMAIEIGALKITTSDNNIDLNDLCVDIDTAQRIKHAAMYELDNTPQDVMNVIANERKAITDRVIFLLARFNNEDLQVYKKAVINQRNSEAAKAPRAELWRHDLAAYLVDNFDSFSQAWQYLESDNDIKYQVRDEYLYYGGRDYPNAKPIKKESFRTGYWSKYNNKE